MMMTVRQEALPEIFDGFGDFATYDAAAQSIIDLVNDLYDIDACFIARLHRDESIVTHVRGNVPLERGDTLQLFARGGKHSLEDGREFSGAPIVVKDQLYGALCTIRMKPSLTAARAEEPSLMMAARILSTILTKELKAEELASREERAETTALVDDLTGLFNRRGWDQLVEREETRAARYGHRATVFMMDLDGLKQVNDGEGHRAGDDVLRRAAHAMRAVSRETDVAARLGSDEFAVLAVETDGDGAQKLQTRLEAAFAAAGVAVSIGSACRESRGSINLAIEHAGAKMYAHKAARKRDVAPRA